MTEQQNDTIRDTATSIVTNFINGNKADAFDMFSRMAGRGPATAYLLSLEINRNLLSFGEQKTFLNYIKVAIEDWE